MHLKDIEQKEILPGLLGKFVHGNNMSWAFWDVKKDCIVPNHNHIHEQIMHVQEGVFEFNLDGKTNNYGSNSVVVIPSNIPHSGIALTDCKIMDVFSPVREEYR